MPFELGGLAVDLPHDVPLEEGSRLSLKLQHPHLPVPVLTLGATWTSGALRPWNPENYLARGARSLALRKAPSGTFDVEVEVVLPHAVTRRVVQEDGTVRKVTPSIWSRKGRVTIEAGEVGVVELLAPGSAR